MNYDSASLSGRAIALLAPVETPRGTRRSEHISQGNSTRALMCARNEALRGASWENTVWFTLALGSLAALLISLR